MPMGMKNSPITFQRMIDRLLWGIKGKFCYGYLDDIICFSNTWEEHLQNLEEILRRMSQMGLRLNFGKCEFFMTRIKYLGHIISYNVLEMDPEKIEALQRLP